MFNIIIKLYNLIFNIEHYLFIFIFILYLNSLFTSLPLSYSLSRLRVLNPPCFHGKFKAK